MVRTDWLYKQSQLSGSRFEAGEVPKNSASLSFHCEGWLALKMELKMGLCRTGIFPVVMMESEERHHVSPLQWVPAVSPLVLFLGGTSPSLDGITRGTYCLRLAS